MNTGEGGRSITTWHCADEKPKMTAKEYLQQVRYIDKRIDNKLALVSRLRDTATNVTVALSDMPRSDSPNLQRMEDTICKIVDLGDEINQEIDRLVDLKREANEAISELTNADQQLVLECRYLDYQTWEQIAETMNFSVRHVTRLHGEALRHFRIPEKVVQKCP